MSEENKKEPQGQETQKPETSLSEQDLKQVSGGGITLNFTKVEYKYTSQDKKGAE